MSRPTRQKIIDQTLRAQELLDREVGEDVIATKSVAEEEMTVEEALAERPILEYDTGRASSRVLFITNDTTFLNPLDDALERFFALSGYFDEMHIMVLRPGTVPTRPVLRVRENIWVYIASAEYWWWTPVIANEVITPEQLVFAGGFRPDLIVALEPFESAVAAQWIGKAYDRPVQVHIRQDFTTKAFRKKSSRNFWRRFIARYVLRKAISVRAPTKRILSTAAALCPPHARLGMLPRFNNFTSIVQTDPEFDVHEKYPMYDKILLFVGKLDESSTLFGAIDVLKYVLANPRVGLIVIGDGETKKDCQNKFKVYGLDTQVVFEREVAELATYYKTCDVLVCTDDSVTSDEITFQAAVAGLPAVMIATEDREEYFEDGVNAYICRSDVEEIKTKIHSLTHDMEVRQKFIEQLYESVIPRLSNDATMYQHLYRNSVETVFIDAEAEEGSESTPQAEPAVENDAEEMEAVVNN